MIADACGRPPDRGAPMGTLSCRPPTPEAPDEREPPVTLGTGLGRFWPFSEASR